MVSTSAEVDSTIVCHVFGDNDLSCTEMNMYFMWNRGCIGGVYGRQVSLSNYPVDHTLQRLRSSVIVVSRGTPRQTMFTYSEEQNGIASSSTHESFYTTSENMWSPPILIELLAFTTTIALFLLYLLPFLTEESSNNSWRLVSSWHGNVFYYTVNCGTGSDVVISKRGSVFGSSLTPFEIHQSRVRGHTMTGWVVITDAPVYMCERGGGGRGGYGLRSSISVVSRDT